MGSELLLITLLRAQAAASAAILLVLLIRGPARRLMGAGLAYRLWAIAPTAAVASLFPTFTEFWEVAVSPPVASAKLGVVALIYPLMDAQAWRGCSAMVLRVWLGGGLILLAVMTAGELRFRHLVSKGRAGPAVMGLSWPQIVLPSDYTARFSAAERSLIRRHERAHILRRDPQANLVIAALQVVGWFNPLVHLAARCARLDQELACDAEVLQFDKASRRTYGEALLKAHLATPQSPLACAWRGSRRPIELRLAMLARPQPSHTSQIAGAAAVCALAVVTAVSIWIVAPRGYAPAFDWNAPDHVVIRAPASRS